MSLDLEAEYNNRARVPEHPAIIAGWARDAESWRAERPPQLLHYGDGERHVLDVFAANAGPHVLFIHGGYWQALDKSFFSHMARGLILNGIGIGVMNYDLCPNVTLGEIVEQARQAAEALSVFANAPVIASGHSAGGHLSACLLATEAHVPAAYAISGVFDLAPLIPTNLNGALKLDAETAENLSPLHWPAPEGKVLDCVVGGAESSEFLRQSRDMAEAWGAEGVETRFEALPGLNHFTVIAPLADPESPMCARIAALARAAG